MHEFFFKKDPLYLKTEASGMGLGANLPQIKDIMNWSQNQTPDTSILWPIAFVSRSLSGTERKQQPQDRSTLNFIWAREFHITALLER